jgi:hypothetical protein
VRRGRLLLGILGGLCCFGLGIAVARWMPPARPPPAEPRIVIDPASIDLLPDASLHLELPPGFDAGAP